MSVPSSFDSGGYTCVACQQWVMNGTVHICPMQIPPPPAPPAGVWPPPSAEPCRAHLFVLTADQVRQIVREDLSVPFND